jgi:FAD synthetase
MLKPVDEAYLGSTTDMFEIVEKLKPDIISIGPDQTFNIDQLKMELEKRGLNAEVMKVEGYREADLDSSCKIIKKIRKMDFDEKIFEKC